MMQHSEQLNELGAALAKAQAAVKGAKKDSTNPFFRSQYADLASVWDACREALTDNGLSVVQFPGYEEGEPPRATVTTFLLHSSGQWLRATAAAPLPDQVNKDGKVSKPDAQAVGSAITYLRRYALQSVASVAPADDDGNAATNRTQAPPRRAPPPPPKPLLSQAPTAAELSEKPKALADDAPAPWVPQWKGKPLTDFKSDELVTLRNFCRKKDPVKYAKAIEDVDSVLSSREGE